MIDAELAALLWILAEAGTPLVVASRHIRPAAELRGAVVELAAAGAGLADTRLTGRAIGDAATFEDTLRQLGAGSEEGAVSDSARELGLVVILAAAADADADAAADADADARVASAHYIRPIERDAAGHLQRRPPALLAAWNAGAAVYDHFDWGISDELATRARMSIGDFVRLQRQRARLLGGHVASRPDAPN